MKYSLHILKVTLIAITCLVLGSSCTKENSSIDRPYITFGVTGIDADTKSLITNETLNSSSTSVIVYGVRNNTESVFNGVTIQKQNDSYNWEPQEKKVWSSGTYSFYGYTCSGPTSAYSIQKEGLKITINQPLAYSEADMVDYMLSHAYKVADGSNNHIVMLYMQHAMACAEIVVKQQIPEHNVILKSIALNGIYRSATMECEDQANANSGGNNVWKTQIAGASDASYSKEFNSTIGQDGTLGRMTLLAVPQQLTQATKLTVLYSVDEDNDPSTKQSEHTDVFDLFNYTPYVWESGHKIRYTLTINTGVELKAEIVDWIEAGYIEGVVLPPKE